MKRFLIIIIFLSVTTFSFAQTAIGIKVTDPLSAVSLITPLYTTVNVNLKTYNAFVSLGGFVHIPLREHWVLQSELLFKHEAVRFRIENSSKDSYYRFEYLDVPFLVQYEGKKAIRGFGFVGFSPKILITSSFYDDSKSVTYGGSSQFNTVMMMGHIGGGVLFERPKWIYTVDARFSTNITNLASGSRTEYINFDKARTFVFSISLGAGYKLSKKMRTISQEELPTITNDSIPAEVNTSQEQDF